MEILLLIVGGYLFAKMKPAERSVLGGRVGEDTKKVTEWVKKKVGEQ